MDGNKVWEGVAWKQADAFPIIARIINETYGKGPLAVGHLDIVSRLPRDGEGRRLLEKAHKVNPKKSLERHASDMVAWFSQKISVGVSEWASHFKPRRIGNHWAYVPVEAVGVFPDEVDEKIEFREVAMRRVTVNSYERDPRAAKICKEKYGTDCSVCGFSFGARYGDVANGMIHVHHLRPLSEIGKEYVLDPIRDLRPVCPNCHAVLHRRTPPYSIEDVRSFLRKK